MCSCPRCSILAFINRLRPSRRDRIRLNSSKALFSSNFEEKIRVIQSKNPSPAFFPAKTESHVWLYSKLCQQKLISYRDSFEEKPWNQSKAKVPPNPDIYSSASKNWSAYKVKRRQMRYGLTWWYRRYWTSPCIIDRSCSILYVTLHNRGLEIMPSASLLMVFPDDFSKETSLYRVL